MTSRSEDPLDLATRILMWTVGVLLVLCICIQVGRYFFGGSGA